MHASDVVPNKQTEINRQKDRLTHVKKIFEWQTDRGENEARR